MNKNDVIPAEAGIQKNVGAALLPGIVTGSRIRRSALPRWYGMTALFLLLFLFAAPAQAETPYDRVMKTGVIRCGYMLWPPFMDRDVNTGKFKGLNYDYMETLAKSLELKVEWTVELNSGLQVETLRSGKADAICSGEGPLVPKTTKYLIYTRPIALFPFYLYGRPDETRTLNDLNNADVKFSVMEEDVSDIVTQKHFPLAQRLSLGQGAVPGQMMLDVTTKKADVMIGDPLFMAEFFKNNAGKLKKFDINEPIAVIPLTLSVLRPDGQDLADLLNQGMNNMQNYGMDEVIFKTYEAQYEGEVFYRPAKPYISQ